MKTIGIDGARLGHWVLAIDDGGADALKFDLTMDLTTLFRDAAAQKAIVVIDVPIGIVSGKVAVNGRACDTEARRIIGGKRAPSVFTPPCREVFGAKTQFDASERNQPVCGRRVTCQGFGILRRIEAVDALMTPTLQQTIREGHPEVTFARLKGGFVERPKKTGDGVRERMELLAEHGVTFDIAAERLRLGRKYVSADDLVDAAAMLVSARRVLSGDALLLGGPERDTRGLLMQMWA